MRNITRLRTATIRAALTVLTVASPACSASTLTSSFDVRHVQLDQTIALPLGATTVVDGTPLRVTFLSVRSDSRCPMGVLCIWAGDADIVLRVDTGAGSTEVDVHSTVDPRSVILTGYRIELVDIQPPRPQNDGPLAYIAMLRITRP